MYLLSDNISIVSSYFNPCLPHHIDYINGAKTYGGYLIAIVNNDKQCQLKGSILLNENDRVKMIRHIKGVDEVILSIDEDRSVAKTLEQIALKYPNNRLYFCNGGDAIPEQANQAEIEICQKYGIALAYNVGGGKTDSSSRIRELLK